MSRRSRKQRRPPFPFQALVEVVAIALWGMLLLRYWTNGDLQLLIHPAYAWLTVSTGIILLGLTGIRVSTLHRRKGLNNTAHVSSLPRTFGCFLLIVVAIAGFIIPPRVFASDLATERELVEFTTLARPQPQAFRITTRSEDRSIVDWVRTLNVYPEPDAYTGEKVKVQGFVIYPTDLPENYLLVSRFIITCCAADVYPIGLPVKLSQTRRLFPPDTWLEIEGKMTTEVLGNSRKLVIQPSSIQEIPEPDNPYEY